MLESITLREELNRKLSSQERQKLDGGSLPRGQFTDLASPDVRNTYIVIVISSHSQVAQKIVSCCIGQVATIELKTKELELISLEPNSGGSSFRVP